MVKLYKLRLEELWFRKKFMGVQETMSYNHAWGGTIPFPENEWSGWHNHWLIYHNDKRYYRYLVKPESDGFIGELAYHFDNERKIGLAGIIVAFMYRGKG